MSLKDLLFSKKEEAKKEQLLADSTFQILNGYTPIFRNWGGKIYESQFVRAAIDAKDS